MLGESYFNMEEYALAAVEYRVLVTNYGYSEYVDEGYFRKRCATTISRPSRSSTRGRRTRPSRSSSSS